MKFSFALIVILVLTASNTTAQEHQTEIGLMASLQSRQSDITLPIRITDRAMFGPSFSFLYVEEGGKDVGLGFFFKSYSRTGPESVLPFLSVRVGLMHASPEIGKSTTDYIGGLGLGADYFLTQSVSIGAEAQLNATKSDPNSNRFGNRGGFNLNTAMAVQLTLFFKP